MRLQSSIRMSKNIRYTDVNISGRSSRLKICNLKFRGNRRAQIKWQPNGPDNITPGALITQRITLEIN